MKPLLEAVDISVIRDGRHILENVSLSVSGDDFITIIGPNGAGKSMLLKCLLGFFSPDAGRIQRQPGLRVGYMPQRLTVDYSLPLEAGRFLRLKRQAGIRQIERVTAETDTADLLERPLYALSGGELQRVLLARALLDSPQLLVLDEPAQNLDVSGQLRFYRLIDQVRTRRGLAILMVSHDLHLVMSSTRQVVCLFHHVCCAGEPQVVTRDPEFISLFGDDMARMMSVYQHSHDHDHQGHEHAG